MTLPQLPDDSRGAAQDTFDFKHSQRRAQVYLRRTLEGAKGAQGMSALRRDHLIAVAAVGGYVIAPTIAGIRKHRRKQARRRTNDAKESTSG